VELAQVDPQRDLDQVRHAEAAELGRGEGGRADDLVEDLGRTPVEPVGQRVAVRHAPDAQQTGQALVGDHHRPDAALAGPAAGPAQGGPVGDLDAVGLEPVEEPGQLPAAGQHAVPAGAGHAVARQRDDPSLLRHLVGALAPRDDQDRLVAGLPVALAEVAQRGAQAARTG
jgi:hypothetical protein